jgi:hypothetical protein
VPKQFLIGFDAPAEVATTLAAATLALIAVVLLATQRPRGDMQAIVLAAGFALSRVGVAAGVALCALSVGVVIAVAVEPDFQREDWRGAAEAAGPATEPRVVVITPVGGCVPMQLYLDHSRLIPEEGFRTSEVVLVGLAQRTPGAEKSPPREPPHPPYSESFREVERIEEPTFTLIRYRSGEPVTVLRGPLQAAGLGGLPSVLVQEPGGAARACRPVGA